MGTNTSIWLVDLGTGVYGNSLQIASTLPVMGSYQYRVMKGKVMLETCWREEGMK